MKREKFHKESSPNCFLAPFVLSVRAKKCNKNISKITSWKKYCKTGKGRKKERKRLLLIRSSNTFSFGSLKCHSSSISSTQPGAIPKQTERKFFRKLVLTAGSIGLWKGSIDEQILNFLWVPIVVILRSSTHNRSKLIKNFIYHKIYDTRLPNGLEFILSRFPFLVVLTSCLALKIHSSEKIHKTSKKCYVGCAKKSQLESLRNMLEHASTKHNTMSVGTPYQVEAKKMNDLWLELRETTLFCIVT